VLDGRVLLYLELPNATEGSTLGVMDLGADGDSFSAPVSLLDPTNAPDWVGDRFVAPAVTSHRDVVHLVFATASGDAIGHATSRDGARFEIDPEPMLIRDPATESDGIGSPSLVLLDDGFALYYESRKTDGETAISRAIGGTDLVAKSRTVILEAGFGCADEELRDETCWNSSGPGNPELRLSRSAAGRAIFRLMYVGARDTERAIGFAASFDGELFEPYPFNPIVDEDETRELRLCARSRAHLII
jgi:hypothetical protein